MTVFVLVREDQSEHGFVDTSIAGIFHDRQAAARQEAHERLRARADGVAIEDDDCEEGEWQVSWKVEEHPVLRTAAYIASLVRGCTDGVVVNRQACGRPAGWNGHDVTTPKGGRLRHVRSRREGCRPGAACKILETWGRRPPETKNDQ